MWNLGHTWSISAEFFLYLTFPAVALTFRDDWSRRTILFVLGAVLLAQAVVLGFMDWTTIMPAALAPDPSISKSRDWFILYSPYPRIPEFLAGCLTAMLAMDRKGRTEPLGKPGRFILPAGFLLAVFTTWGNHLIGPEPVAIQRPLLVLGVCAIVYHVMLYDSWVSRLLSCRLMLFGGERSYSTYLLHPLIFALFVKTPESILTFGGMLRFCALLGIAIATVIVFASGSYAVIEVPARAWLRKSLNGPRRRRVLAQSGVLAAAMLFIIVNGGPDFIFPHRHARLKDIRSLQAALEAYQHARGEYPVAASWTGRNRPGVDIGNWLHGLVPEFLASLPRDPRGTDIANAQYVYRSDGRDYKLIALSPEDCEVTVFLAPRLSDPARNEPGRCAAYGVWTPGAVDW